MREYWILTKLQLSSLYGINKIRHARDEETRRKARRSIVALIAMVFGLGWGSTVYSMLFASVLAPFGQMPSLLGIMSVAGGALVLLFSVFEVKGVLFGFGDYDMVMSWPVRTWAVVAARVTTMYAYNLVYALLFMLPAGVIYAIFAQPPVWFYAVYLVALLSLPLLPTVLGAVLGTLVTVLTARMKGKSIMTSLFQILLAGGIIVFSTSMTNGMEKMEEKAVTLGAQAANLYPPAGWLMRAAEGDVLPLLLSAVASVLIFGLFTKLLARGFVALNGRLSAIPHSHTRLSNRQRATGALRALYRMEWKRYMGSSLYLANTAFGYVMMLGIAVVLGIVHPPVIDEIFADPNYPGMRAIIPFVLAMFAAMSQTTFAAISIEGKRLWIVKSLPVRVRDWYLGKILVSLTLAVPSIVLSAVIMSFGMRFSALELLYAMVTPAAFALLFAVFGLLINLLLLRFDWTTETEVVKQSAATLICVFSGMAAAGIPIALLLVGNAALVTPIATAAALLLAALLFALLMRKNEQRLYRL